MGVKPSYAHCQGSKKGFTPVWGGVGPYKTPLKPILTLKMVDSALENKKIIICWLNDMGVKTMLRPLQGVQERLPPVWTQLWRGG